VERTLLVEIITPERLVYAGESTMVIARTVDGEIGILPLHAPLVTVLVPDVLRLKYEDREEAYAVGGGYMVVKEDHLTILAESAEPAGAIDVEKAKEAQALAQAQLTEALGSHDRQGIEAAQKALATASAEVKVASLR
jgi:F-type H+-transporting ATPase subunit epsilon